MRSFATALLGVAGLAFVCACGGVGSGSLLSPPPDSGKPDATVADGGEGEDGGVEAAVPDAGVADAGGTDVGTSSVDASPDSAIDDAAAIRDGAVSPDGGTDASVDASDVDATRADASDSDASGVDASGMDASSIDAGRADAGGLDASGADAGNLDAGAGCIATQPLDTSAWVKSPNLQITVATTTEYACTWIGQPYDYKTCDGWISDTFIGPSSEWAVVGWNLQTNAMYTMPSGSHPYSEASAKDCASFAVQTIFAGGNSANVDVRF